VVAPVEELERLHDELDLADAAAPELDVGRLAALRADGAVDLALHRADRRDDARVEPRAIDGLARQAHVPGADRRIAGRDARLDQRLPLPQLGALARGGGVPVEGGAARPPPPLGPQAQIDGEHVALVGDLLEQRGELAADAGEILAVGRAARAAARRLAVLAVDEHQIDVGRVVELLAAELAHRDDRDAGLGPRPAVRRPVPPPRGPRGLR